MTINTRELLLAVSQLTDQKNMRVSLQQTARWGVITGASVMAGGLLFGPIGLAIGGIVGGCTGAWRTQGQFRPVGQIIMHDLTTAQQQLLVNRLQAVVAGLRIEDAALLLPILMGNKLTMQAVLSTVTTFITNDLHLQLA